MSPEIEAKCGSYCFNAVSHLLDHLKVLQNQVDGYNEKQTTRTLEKLDNLEEHFKYEEEKRKEVSRTLNSTLKTHIDTLDTKLKAQIDTIKSQIGSQSEILEGVFPIIRKNTPGKEFMKIGSKYYYIPHDERVNWFEAVHKCISLGAHLVSFQSEAEFSAILPHLRSYVDYWFDLNDLGEEGKFLSIATGLPPSFVHWHPGNPSNTNNEEHCCDVWYNSKHLMNDNICHLRIKSYICEF